MYMYTNIVQYCNCQSQKYFSTLNITLRMVKCYRVTKVFSGQALDNFCKTAGHTFKRKKS